MTSLLHAQVIILAERGIPKFKIRRMLEAQDAKILHSHGGTCRAGYTSAVCRSYRIWERATATLEARPLLALLEAYTAEQQDKEARGQARAASRLRRELKLREKQVRMAEIAKDPLKLMRRLDRSKRFEVVKHIDTVAKRLEAKGQ